MDRISRLDFLLYSIVSLLLIQTSDVRVGSESKWRVAEDAIMFRLELLLGCLVWLTNRLFSIFITFRGLIMRNCSSLGV